MVRPMCAYPGQYTCQDAAGEVELGGAPRYPSLRRRWAKTERRRHCVASCCSLIAICMFHSQMKERPYVEDPGKLKGRTANGCSTVSLVDGHKVFFPIHGEWIWLLLPKGANDLCDEYREYSCHESLSV